MTEPVVLLEAVSFSYGVRRVLTAVDLAVAAGERVALLGPSGSGKSSLLRLIAGLDRPAEGRIALNGTIVSDHSRSLPPEDRGVGLVFQDDALFPHLTVFENVAFGLRHLSRDDRKSRAMDALTRLGLGDRARDWPHRLSGGEQQRVAVARALAPRPSVMLMDEPFSRLDSDLRRNVREDIMAVLKAAGVAVVLVTHDAEEAMSCADRLVLLSDGRVLQSGPPEECYLRPTSVDAARLLGPVNAVPATIEDGNVLSVLGCLKSQDLPPGPAQLLFRPEDLGTDSTGVEADRLSTTFTGPTATVRLSVQGHLLEMTCPARDVPISATVRIGLLPHSIPTVLPHT